MVSYTLEEREKLVERFNLQKEERREALLREIAKLGDIFEARIQRGVASVPKKFVDLRMKDVLGVERDHKIKIFTVISDIQELKAKNNTQLENEENIKTEMDRLRKKKLHNFRAMQKRKESLASTGRVSKAAHRR